MARVEKERAVRSSRAGETLHYVEVHRDGRRVLCVGVPDPPDVLGLLNSAPAVMCADSVGIAVDSWGADGPTNPISGKRWELGDMEKIVEQDLGLARGLVREQLTVMGFERGGGEACGQLFYTHDREARTIWWGADAFEPGEAIDGRFLLAGRAGFDRPTVIDVATRVLGPPPDDMDLDDLINRSGVSWVLTFPRTWRVVHGPKGPPLNGQFRKRSHRECPGQT
jgi:hypothetical protein